MRLFHAVRVCPLESSWVASVVGDLPYAKSSSSPAPHFTYGETETQRGEVAYPWYSSDLEAEWGRNRSLWPRPHLLHLPHQRVPMLASAICPQTPPSLSPMPSLPPQWKPVVCLVVQRHESADLEEMPVVSGAACDQPLPFLLSAPHYLGLQRDR